MLEQLKRQPKVVCHIMTSIRTSLPLNYDYYQSLLKTTRLLYGHGDGYYYYNNLQLPRENAQLHAYFLLPGKLLTSLFCVRQLIV
jgi:hypothetical protein